MASEPESIDTDVSYFLSPENGGGPTTYLLGTVGARRRKFDPHAVKITNIRGKEEFFSLDTHGFELAHYPAEEKEFAVDEKIREGYYREVEQMMKELTGASDVYVFSHVVRRDPHQKSLDMSKELRDDEPIQMATPAMFAHVDQSYDGAKILVNSVAEHNDAAARIAKKIKNHRRPLKPVTREPLAVCDARSVVDSDLREITLKIPTNLPTYGNKSHGLHNSPYGPDREDPTKEKPSQKLWQVVANPQHKWYWPSQMKPEEVLLIKCFDSRTDVARRAPHSAIRTPMDKGPARESIEARCIVVWDDQASNDERAML